MIQNFMDLVKSFAAEFGLHVMNAFNSRYERQVSGAEKV